MLKAPAEVTGEEDPRGVGPEFGRMREGPGDGLGVVFEEGWERDLGRETVVRHHDDHAAPDQRAGDEAVGALGPGIPTAAIDEHHQREPAAGQRRPVDIEGVAVARGVSYVGGFGDVGVRYRGVQQVGGRAAGETSTQTGTQTGTEQATPQHHAIVASAARTASARGIGGTAP